MVTILHVFTTVSSVGEVHRFVTTESGSSTQQSSVITDSSNTAIIWETSYNINYPRTSSSSVNHKQAQNATDTHTTSCAGTGKGLNQPNVAPALA